MKSLKYRAQSGFALLIFVVVLMGIGGIALTGFAQKSIKEVKKGRFEHNKEVLQKAKQALLMFAYNYPQTNVNGVGPGRLPCPDDDNDGLIGAGVNTAQCNATGRLPMLDPRLNFYDARDASGERLWYAVSEEFRNFNPGDVGGNTNGDDRVNSESMGTISIFDQAENLLYDGAANGVAAVIIAPGFATDGQDRSIANGDDPSDTTLDTDPGIINPANYLDTFNAFDNSSFLNAGNNPVDGFILGPVRASANDSTVVVNDQIIIITVDEVIAMAEKATLEAYRNALDQYAANTDPGGGTGLNHYPWLDSYSNDNIGLGAFDATVSPAAPNPVIGRLPSIFANYFVTNISQQIPSEINMLLDVAGHPVSGQAPAGNISFLADGNLSSSFNSGTTFTGHVWDGHPVNAPTLANDGVWEACPYVTGTEDDCNQNVAGDFIGGPTSDIWLVVRKVDFTLGPITVNPFEFSFANILATPLTYTPPDVANHAYVAASYTNLPAYVTSVTWSEDANYQNNPFVQTSNGNLAIVGADTISVGVRYYPELPNWALVNQWHDTIQMAYSSAVQPDGIVTACTVGADCLILQNSGGVINNKSALLVMSGTDIDADGDGNAGFFDDAPLNLYSDDLGDVFEGENSTSPIAGGLAEQLTFDRRPPNGNDIVLIVQ